MKDLFVPYSIALHLKKLGFDEACFSAYRNYDDEEMLMGVSIWTNSGTENNHEGYCAAPLYQQITDWFREKHKIHISVGYPMILNKEEYRAIIAKLNHTGYYSDTCDFTKHKTYYEALNKAIEEACKLI